MTHLQRLDMPVPTSQAGNLQSPVTRSITFSSYPGQIGSIDDFYVISTSDNSARLIVTETTLYNFYSYSYDANNARPKSLLYWMRAMVASMLAVDGDTWAQAFVREQSGTYNNEVGLPYTHSHG